MISLFFFGPIRSLVNESSKSRYLECSPGVISLSRSLAISKTALSRTFCPVPSEFKVAGLVCILNVVVKDTLMTFDDFKNKQTGV